MQSLKDAGFAVVFLGFGLPDPNVDTPFAGLTAEHGFFHSKAFLPRVARRQPPPQREIWVSWTGFGFCGQVESPQEKGHNESEDEYDTHFAAVSPHRGVVVWFSGNAS